MEVKAVAKNVRISAKKARLVVDLIRGKQASEAVSQLMFMHKKAAVPVRKVLESAIANAVHNNNLNKDELIVKVAKVDEGFTMKRWMPRAFGRATPLRKRTCHITVAVGPAVVAEEEKVADKVEKTDNKDTK